MSSLTYAPTTSSTPDVTFADTVSSFGSSATLSAVTSEGATFTSVTSGNSTLVTNDVIPADAPYDTTTPANHDITFTNASSLNGTTNATDVDFEALNMQVALSLLPTLVYVGLLIVTGIVGNSIVFAVYFRRFKPSATRSYVLTMSVIDLLSNVLALPSEIVDIRFTYTFNVPQLCRLGRFTNSFLSVVSAFLLVAVAKDRFNKICHPLEKTRSARQIKGYIALCCAGSLALSVPFAVLNGAHTVKTPIENVTGVTCSVDDAFVGTLFPTVYSGVMALTFIVCVAIMSVSYVLIARALWSHKKKLVSPRRPEASGVDASGADAGSGKAAKKGWAGASFDASSGPRSVPVVDQDSSSGARSAQVDQDWSSGGRTVSTDKPSSSAEVVALTHNQDAFPDENVLLMSVRNLNYEGPLVSDKKDSNEGIPPAPSGTEMTTLFSLLLDGEGQTPGTDSVRDADDKIDDGKEDDMTNTGKNHEQLREDETEEGKEGDSGHPEANAATDVTASAETTFITDSTTDLLPEKTAAANAELPSSPEQRDDNDDRRDKPPSLLKSVLSSGARKQYSMRLGSKATAAGASRRKPARQRGSVKKIPSSTTFMMFVLTAMFVVNYLPHLVIISMRAAVSGDLHEGLTGWLLNAYNIALRSYFMNCAVNSLVYGFCNARFRNECRNLICRRARR